MSSINTGFAALNAAIERSADQGSRGNFVPNLQWKDDRNEKGELYQHNVRFVTEDITPCQIYEYVPCKDGKLRDFIIPSSVNLDGPDVVKELGVKVPQYGNKSNLIDPKARGMAFGLVVVREEKSEMINGRRVLTYSDKMETVKYEKDGQEVEETRPMYRIVKQSIRNFWPQVATYYERYGTVMDRDYTIERRRNDKDTSYIIIPCDPVEGLRDPEEVAAAYTPPIDMKKFVEGLADPERARKLLAGDSSDEGSGSNSGEGESALPKSEAPTDSKFADFRDQLINQR